MPASSRKRNKGKERKAKQLAKKEENDRAMSAQFWRRLCNTGMRCDHGYPFVIPADDHPVSNFMDEFILNIHKGLVVGQNLRAIYLTHKDILVDESYRKFVLDILVHIGTNMMLSQGRYDIANAMCVAQSIVALEHYNGEDDINFVINKRVVRSKWRDLEINSSEKREGLKFYRKRTSCKCLKKMHLEARKTLPKLGICEYCKEEKERVLLDVCSRCKVEQYCSRECQVTDWSKHKGICGLIRHHDEL